MYCKTCRKEKVEQSFYRGFTECKDCVGDSLNKFSNEVGHVKSKELLHKNNYIINQELLDDIFFGDKDEYRGKSNSNKLSEYLRKINSLPQYKEYKYRVVTEEKSDIDFINDDIKQLKKNIQNALDNHDYNTHGKWMNSLRDALELRCKLQRIYKM
jgi:predicted ATPase